MQTAMVLVRLQLGQAFSCWRTSST
jgi:hypothetical protein